jgi:biopolymer transport protein ExbD
MAANAAARARARLELSAEPNVIPFIDVLLVLLIVFMVTAPKPTTDIRLDLVPHVPGRASLIDPTIVQLREAPGGGYRVFVGDEETTLDQLSERAMAHVLAVDPAITVVDAQADARVFVQSELDVAYANVVAVVDDLQQAHFQKVSVIAQNADSEG